MAAPSEVSSSVRLHSGRGPCTPAPPGAPARTATGDAQFGCDGEEDKHRGRGIDGEDDDDIDADDAVPA